MRIRSRRLLSLLGAAVAACLVIAPATVAPAQGAPGADDGALTSNNAFDEVFTFGDYTPGPVAGQQGWATSSDSVKVTADPARAGNQVLEMTGSNVWARHSIPEIAKEDTGTIFFRMRRDGPVNVNAGLSDHAAPSQFSDFEVQANNQYTTTLNARDGGSFYPSGIFALNTWQCIWMVPDNATDHYRMYALGGQYKSVTQLPTGTDKLFGFRNGHQDNPLQSFFARNGSPSTGTYYLDDIAVDSKSVDLTVPSGNPQRDCQTGEPTQTGHFRALVFSETKGFRHASIPDGIAAIKKLGAEHGFSVDATEDSSAFTDENLAKYAVVIWLSATGDVLDKAEQGAFQRYIEAGGGFVGIHAGGTDTECSPAGCPAGDGDWPWFRGLAGARFVGHPSVQQAQVVVDDDTQPSTRFLPGRWTRTDEWYDWSTKPRRDVHVLLTVDEHTYHGGTMGADHPIAWCQDYDGGRSWYTAMGHTKSSYTEPLFLKHILGGIRTAAGVVPSDCSLPTPYSEGTPPLPAPVKSNLALQVKQVAQLPQSSTSPPTTDRRAIRWARINYLGEVPDGSGRLYVPDLNGNLYFLENGKPHVYLDVKAQFPHFVSSPGLGTGFGFVAFDPDFATNGRFYTVHTEAGSGLPTPDLPTPSNTAIHSVITEWTATDPSADTFSGTHREVLRLGFAHGAHDIQQIGFNPTAKPGDADYGLLYIAAGDGGADGLHGGAGANNRTPQDLSVPQGKLLRIDPRGNDGPNGRFGIPPDNPFVGQPGALPEIYAYGFRDPHRFSWDPAEPHRMFLGHIGEHDVESVDEVQPGDNFGWSVREGPFMFIKPDDCHVYPLPSGDKNYGYTYPVAAYSHDAPPGYPCTDVGHAIMGGFVYRSDEVPALQGKYLFADNVTGRLFYTNVDEMQRDSHHLATIHQFKVLNQNGQLVSFRDLATADSVGNPNRVDVRFGRDANGQLYLLSKGNGRIWKIVGARQVSGAGTSPVTRPDVLPSLASNLVDFYDFEHPAPNDPEQEIDQGRSGTTINLINGGVSMRVPDGAYPASHGAIQTKQVNPTTAGNDDWKAGTYLPGGVATLSAFNHVREASIMFWIKLTGPNPGLSSNTADPTDYFNAIGMPGVLSGTSDGHAVRFLLEVEQVSGGMHLVALGRRVDTGSSQVFAANEDWHKLLPQNQWVFLAATFNFDTGEMALYRNGEAVPGFYATPGDPWGVDDGSGQHYTSATDPRGIKIGGSFPQNAHERNPCNCRFDSVMFLDRAATGHEVKAQYELARAARP